MSVRSIDKRVLEEEMSVDLNAKEIVIPSSVKTTKGVVTYKKIADASELKRQNYKEFDYSTYHNAEKVTLSDGIEIVGKCAFYRAQKLQELIMPDTVEKVGEGALETCYELTSIRFPPKVKRIEDEVCGYCFSLKNAEIPKGAVSIGRLAFTHCHSLTDIEIPDTVTQIGIGAFANCENLEHVTLPSRFIIVEKVKDNIKAEEVDVENIDLSKIFPGCDKLKSITIGSKNYIYNNGRFTPNKEIGDKEIEDLVKETMAKNEAKENIGDKDRANNSISLG